MPTATIDGIETHFEVTGSGPPLLMFSPGGFEATLANWTHQGIYAQIQPLRHLSARFSCITFDRRESGLSGGRVERITWSDYVEQGRGLLSHLGLEAAHVLGGCMGCPPAVAFAARYPSAVLSMILYWPVGGARYRLRNDARFAEHLAYVRNHGLEGVVALAQSHDNGFGVDPRVGLWASVLRRDSQFRDAYLRLDPASYEATVAGIARTLVDRDSAPGAEPEDLLGLDIPTLVVPGNDASHARSAAEYLHECIRGSEYWDVPAVEQTEASAPQRLLTFLESVGQPRA